MPEPRHGEKPPEHDFSYAEHLRRPQSTVEEHEAISEEETGEFVHPEPPPLRHPIETIPPVDASTIENIAKEESQDTTEVDSLPSVTQGDSAATENPPEAHDFSYADHLRKPGSTVEENEARIANAERGFNGDAEEQRRNRVEPDLSNVTIEGIVANLEEFSDESSLGGSIVSDLSPSDEIAEAATPAIWAKIDSHVSGGTYTWDEVRRNSGDTDWETFTGNLTHDTDRNALEVSEATDVSSGSIVLLKSEVDADGLETFYFSKSASPSKSPFWAKLSTNARPFDWDELVWNAGDSDFDVLSGGRNGDDAHHHVNAYQSLPVGLIVEMYELTNSAGNLEYVFTIPHDGTSASPALSARLDLTLETEGSEAVLDTHWDIHTDQSVDFGVAVSVCSRVFYDNTAGTPILYGYRRDLTFDTGGRLLGISGEARYVIDQPVECS